MDLRLKEILAQRGITLKDFAQMSGISQSNLSNYLNGNISPTLDTLKKMASFLEIDVVELFKEKDDIELYAKHDGILYPINKNDILEIILKKKIQK
ncbi:MAG: helix-turn-helix transcriptional regulator [Paludibacteraceae bacterium]|nr:helix-turn-helix transcriptional regulator [Paludibacteraceae bacterium]